MMEKILVTGAGGFIGYNLCNQLTLEGYEVIGVDLHYPEEMNHDPLQSFQSEIGDFRDLEKMGNWLEGVDVIIHLASAHLQISLDPDEYWNINVHSLFPFLNLCRSRNIRRFIHVSSVGVYGDIQELPANEKTLCRPQSIYGETKLAGENEVLKFAKQTGFPVVVVRPAWVYGPYCPRTLKIFRTLRKGKFLMIGKGLNLRHPVYIADIINAFKLCINNDAALGKIFLLAGQKAITTNELVASFCKVTGFSKPKIRLPFWLGFVMAWGIESVFGLAKIEPPISRRSLEFFDTNNAFDISKAKNLLGFEPKFSFEDGLRDCLEWIKKSKQKP